MRKLLTGDERMSELTVRQFLAVNIFNAGLQEIKSDYGYIPSEMINNCIKDSLRIADAVVKSLNDIG